MKKLLPLIALLIMSAPLSEAQAQSRHDRPDRGGDRDGPPKTQERSYSIDEAINLVESRSGGRYVSGNRTGPSTFVIKVQVGPNIVAYRVDMANRSLSKM